MNLPNVLTCTSKRFSRRCISSGCQYDTNFKLNAPQFRNVVKATSHSDRERDLLKLREHIRFLYGRICAYQPVPNHPDSCFLSFANKGSRYYALNAVVQNYTFEPVNFPSEHALFPLIAVVSTGTSQRGIAAVLKYIKEKAGQPDSFDFTVQQSDVVGDKTLNMFFTFHDPEVFKKVVPDNSVQKIPGYILQNQMHYPDNNLKDAFLYSYLPLYLDPDLSTMINSLVIEYDKFKKVDCSIIFNIFDILGSVKRFESAGKNQVRVHFDKLHQSPLFSGFTQQSLLGRALLHLEPREGWKAKVHVHIPRSDDNPIVEKKLRPFILRNSVALRNVEEHSLASNITFVSRLLKQVGCNPGFISATYFPEEKKMEVLLEHAAYVDKVVDAVNSKISEAKPHYRGITAEPCDMVSDEGSVTAETV